MPNQITKQPSYLRGSEWRKWDLHVHTPLSIVQNYGGEAKWDDYITDLENLSKDFSVIGINDYFFLDGYKYLQNKQKSGKLSNIKLFPVVEFRIKMFAGVNFEKIERINLHVIFSNEIPIDTIQSQFLNSLESSFYLEKEGQWTRNITRESVIELGREIKSKVPKTEYTKYGSDLQEGFNNLVVDEEKIFESLKKDCFRGKYLIALGKTEWDSINWTDHSISTKKSIINRADIIFTASESVEKYNKAKQSLVNQGFKDCILLDCSDAHDFSYSENKDRIGNCNTWIKADPTFEGLKQIIHEPDQRVAIQKERPDQDKIDNASKIIKSVSFIKKDTSNDIKTFPEIIIPLNPYLNTIIGGKSSGKSALGYYIARTALGDEGVRKVAEKIDSIDEIEKSFKNYDNLLEKGDYCVELEWLNNDKSSTCEGDSSNKFLTYIPQLYFYELSRKYDESGSGFNQQIKDILQESEGGEKIHLKDRFTTLEREQSENVNQISNLIEDFYNSKLKIEENNLFFQQQGNLDTVKQTIEKFQAEKSEIEKTSNISLKEKEEFDKLNKKEKNLLNLEQFETNNIDKLRRGLDTESQLYESFLSKIPVDIQEPEVFESNREFIISNPTDEIHVTTYLFVRSQQQDLQFKYDELIKISENNLEKYRSELKTIEKDKEPIKDKFSNKKRLEDLDEKIKHQNQLLKTIEAKLQENSTCLQNQAKIKKEIWDKITNNKSNWEGLITEINENEISTIDKNQDKPIKIISTIAYQPHFFDELNSAIHGRNDSEIRKELNLFQEKEKQTFDEEDYKKIFDEITNKSEGKQLFNQGKLPKEVLKLFTQFLGAYTVNFKITRNGDDFNKLSQGTQGLILAQMILNLSNSSHPIIIDQPEDNLDNRTVFKDLVTYIKEKKIKRQIIIITHNANLVVGTDAEEVIVANENGAESKNKDGYKFNYFSGSLENTKTQDKNEAEIDILKSQGIREHVCEILEGGETAFKKRENKYDFTKK